MYAIITLSLIVGTVVCSPSNQSVCCYPEKMEGTTQFLQEKVSVYNAFDFTAQRLLRSTSDINSENFRILDLKSGIYYDFTSDGCRAVDKISLDHGHDRCIDNSLLTETDHVIGAGQGVATHKYEYKEEHFTVTQFMSRDGDVCFPLMIFSSSDTRANITVIFLDMAATVSTDKLYADLDNCQDDQLHSNQSP